MDELADARLFSGSCQLLWDGHEDILEAEVSLGQRGEVRDGKFMRQFGIQSSNGARKKQLVQTTVPRLPFSANQVDDHIGVLQCPLNGVFVF